MWRMVQRSTRESPDCVTIICPMRGLCASIDWRSACVSAKKFAPENILGKTWLVEAIITAVIVLNRFNRRFTQGSAGGLTEPKSPISSPE